MQSPPSSPAPTQVFLPPSPKTPSPGRTRVIIAEGRIVSRFEVSPDTPPGQRKENFVCSLQSRLDIVSSGEEPRSPEPDAAETKKPTPQLSYLESSILLRRMIEAIDRDEDAAAFDASVLSLQNVGI